MDTKQIVLDTDATMLALVAEINALSPEQVNMVPFEGSWTAGQCIQHMVLSCGGFVELMNGPTKDTQRNPFELVEKIRAVFLNFETKMISPAFVAPEIKSYQRDELLHSIKDIHSRLKSSMETLELSKTCLAFELPAMGFVTRIEAISFILYHTQRHIAQLKKIHQGLMVEN